MRKVYLVAILALIGCVSKPVSSATFDAIVVDGVDAEITNGPQQVTPGLHKVVIYDKTLYVTKQGAPGVVKITVPTLQKLRVTGNGHVRGKLISNGVQLEAEQQGSIDLEGQLHVTSILQRGRGTITVSWIKSPNLLIDSNNSGVIAVSGVVDKLVTKLHGAAKLDAKYLRAKDATVIAMHKAYADIMALDFLQVYAVNTSSINYFKIPKKLVTFTREQAKVLHPNWLS